MFYIHKEATDPIGWDQTAALGLLPKHTEQGQDSRQALPRKENHHKRETRYSSLGDARIPNLAFDGYISLGQTKCSMRNLSAPKNVQ